MKERAKGGIVVAVRKEMKEMKIKELNKKAVELCFTHSNDRWRIITMYSQNIEESLECLFEEVKEEDEEFLILGGD